MSAQAPFYEALQYWSLAKPSCLKLNRANLHQLPFAGVNMLPLDCYFRYSVSHQPQWPSVDCSLYFHLLRKGRYDRASECHLQHFQVA